KGRERAEFFAAPFGDRSRETGLEVAEEQERRRGSKLFTHEKEWRRRREQDDRERCAHPLVRRKRVNALAHCAVADLIVILEERNERRRRQCGARFAARTPAAPE